MSSNKPNTDNTPKNQTTAKTDPNNKTGGAQTGQRQMEQGLSSGKGGGDPKRDQRQFGGRDEGNSGQRRG